jgi:GntR family transcriptional regulator
MNEGGNSLRILQSSGIPIYQQIADQLREDIVQGRLKAGEELPSIRGLAKELKISVITTMKAYEQLQSEGYVTAMQGKGFYVNAQDTDMIREQNVRKVEAALANAITAAGYAGMQEEELIDTLRMLIRLKKTD